MPRDASLSDSGWDFIPSCSKPTRRATTKLLTSPEPLILNSFEHPLLFNAT